MLRRSNVAPLLHTSGLTVLTAQTFAKDASVFTEQYDELRKVDDSVYNDGFDDPCM